jgi:uncharacterized metal-binding protein YceD (DUF177 family)
MGDKRPEFSRLVSLARLGNEPFRQRIEATPEERERLTRRFDLASLDCLVAKVELRRQNHDVVLLEAQFEAKFEQYCVVTLEPVRGAVCDNFSLVYGPPPEEDAEIVVGSDEPAFEPLIGDAIDIGEAVAQELSLALPISPRHPDADAEDWAVDEPLEGPFAALAHLRKDGEC